MYDFGGWFKQKRPTCFRHPHRKVRILQQISVAIKSTHFFDNFGAEAHIGTLARANELPLMAAQIINRTAAPGNMTSGVLAVCDNRALDVATRNAPHPGVAVRRKVSSQKIRR